MADVRAHHHHNQTVLDDIEEGDLLEFERGLYSHWGVYVGDGRVIHLTGDNDGIADDMSNPSHLFSVWGKQFGKALVKCDDFWDIVNPDCKAKINNKDAKGRTALSRSEILENAVSKLGRIGYNVLWNNCEHFANWCRFGESKSDQVNGFLTYMAIGLGTVVGAMFVANRATKSKRRNSDDME